VIGYLIKLVLEKKETTTIIFVRQKKAFSKDHWKFNLLNKEDSNNKQNQYIKLKQKKLFKFKKSLLK